MSDVSHMRLHEWAIVGFEVFKDQTNPSRWSHKGLIERDIINFQALTDRANH